MHPAAPLLLGLALLPAQDEDPRAPLAEGRFGQALDARAGGFIAPADPRYGRRPLTIELWARLTDRGDEAVLLSNESPTSGTHWEVFAAEGSGAVGLRAPGLWPSTLTADASLGDGLWHHVAVLLGDDRVSIYVDGEPSAEVAVEPRDLPPQLSGLAVGTRIEDRSTNAALVDDVRITEGLRDPIVVPGSPAVKDDRTIALWSFDESEADYLAHWTPGGETNQRGLPYPHRYAEFEFETDADWQDDRWQLTDKGPFVTHSIRLPGHEVGPKAMAIFPGDDRSTAILFDLERCTPVAYVRGAELKVDPLRFGLLRKPSLAGDVAFSVVPAKGWRRPIIDEERLEPLGRSEVDYKGLRLHGDRVLLEYEVLGRRVLETFEEVRHGDELAFARHLRVEAGDAPLVLTVADLAVPTGPSMPLVGVFEQLAAAATAEEQAADRSPAATDEFVRGDSVVLSGDGATREFSVKSSTDAVRLAAHGADTCVVIPAGRAWTGAVVLMSGPAERQADRNAIRGSLDRPADLDALRDPGPRRWGEPIAVEGSPGADDGRAAYVIDTVPIPYENPFRALFYLGGIGFFPDGTAAVCTAHGDVWLVRGLDEGLSHVTWQRFAAGLYQPLGLEVVDGKVIVLGRDQLTRLHDLNDDGEADWYETFNNDLVISGQDHAFAMRLDRDPEGNFYFHKSGSSPPHGSTIMKLSADGEKLSVYARGFRHTNGIGVGPDGTVTAADNEGEWVPSSKIDLVREGGFYGYLGGEPEAPEGVRPEPPLCYVPKVADNSSGGQVWATSDRWGDYHRGGMLHLSWGRCTMLAVLEDVVAGVRQGAVVRFPDLTFLAGPSEAEFAPHDGQLYVVGLDGWQTGAVADGSLQRVRWTGREPAMPGGFRAFEDGVLLSFPAPIDPAIAADPARYRVERWNYRWSHTYGSFHYTTADPPTVGHDALAVVAAEPTADGRGVFLRIDDMAPVDQFAVAADLRESDGSPLRFDLYATIHALRAGRP